MSHLFNRQTVDVTLSALDAGLVFAESNNHVQADFILGLTYAVEDYTAKQSWPMQCRLIVDGMTADDKRRAAAVLSDYWTICERCDMPTSASVADLTEWRMKMAARELEQAQEFDDGQRDYYFTGIPGANLDLLRRGAIRGCVATALSYLTNRGTTLKRQRQEHDAGVCDELCPSCNPQEYE